jgi:cytidine deaminase
MTQPAPAVVELEAARAEALVQAARRVRERAYAPYSGFAVGAALLDEHGQIHAGANVENAAYPQGLCAEASALAQLVSSGARHVLAVAVVGQASEPVTPCGGCRQKLREFASPHVPVLVADLHTLRAQYTLEQLLPASFGPDHLLP